MKNQKGYFNLDALHELAVLAAIGIISLVGGAVWCVWWLAEHITITVS